MSFDKEKFLKANKSLREKNPNFGDPFPKGVYVCDLIDCELNNAKSSGREQVSFIWEVMPTDDLAGRKIYEHIATDDEIKGEAKYSQAEILNMKLGQLGVKDMASFIENFKNNLKWLAGKTKARLRVDHQGDFQQIRLEKLLENAFQNGPVTNVTHHQPVEKVAEPQVPKDTRQVGTYEQPKTEVTIAQDSKILFKHPTEGEQVATVKMANPAIGKFFLQFDNDKLGAGMYDIKDMVKPLSNGETQQQTLTNVPKPTEQAPFSEEVEEVIEEVPLANGMNVKFIWQNAERSGEVKELVPDKNAVKIKSVDPADGKAKLYTVDISKVTPIS